MDFSVTKYRISTITVTGSINSEIYLDKLFNLMSKHRQDEISYLEYGSNKQDLQSAGTKTTKNKKNKTKEVTKRRFDNQLTIVMNYMENRYNIKLFKELFIVIKH